MYGTSCIFFLLLSFCFVFFIGTILSKVINWQRRDVHTDVLMLCWQVPERHCSHVITDGQTEGRLLYSMWHGIVECLRLVLLSFQQRKEGFLFLFFFIYCFFRQQFFISSESLLRPRHKRPTWFWLQLLQHHFHRLKHPGESFRRPKEVCFLFRGTFFLLFVV